MSKNFFDTLSGPETPGRLRMGWPPAYLRSFSGSSARWAPSERFSGCSPGFSPAWNVPPFLSPRGDGLRTEDSVAAAGKPIHKKRKNFLIFLLTDQKWFGILSRQNKEG
ncbi:MAG: hypothetical protein ACLSHO_01680 [Dysosmobacter sp.]